jgi:hypothetical protein
MVMEQCEKIIDMRLNLSTFPTYKMVLGRTHEILHNLILFHEKKKR